MKQNPYSPPGSLSNKGPAGLSRQRRFEFEGRLTYDDVYGRKESRSRWSKLGNLYTTFAAIVMLPLFFWTMLLNGHTFWSATRTLLLSPWTLIPGSLLVLFLGFVAWATRVSKNQSKLGQGEFTANKFTIDENGVSITTPTSTTTFRWMAFNSADVDPARISLPLLPPNIGSVLLLKNWFSNVEEWQELQRFVQELVNANPKPNN